MYSIFEQLLQKHGVSSYRVSKETGIAQSVLSAWKTGKSQPKADKLQLIADYFGISIEELMGKKMDTSEEDVQKNAHQEEYYIDDETREMAQFLTENPEYKVLFDASRKVKPEDVEFVKEFIERMTGGK